jgi:hypothetical protein
MDRFDRTIDKENRHPASFFRPVLLGIHVKKNIIRTPDQSFHYLYVWIFS